MPERFSSPVAAAPVTLNVVSPRPKVGPSAEPTALRTAYLDIVGPPVKADTPMVPRVPFLITFCTSNSHPIMPLLSMPSAIHVPVLSEISRQALEE